MQQVRSSSNDAPNRVRLSGRTGADVRRLVFEASRRAEAMGLMEPEVSPREEPAALRLLASRVRRAGIASAAADRLNDVQVNNVEAPNAAELVPLLETLIAALEASPVPKFEWAGLGRTFGAEALASLINVSMSSRRSRSPTVTGAGSSNRSPLRVMTTGSGQCVCRDATLKLPARNPADSSGTLRAIINPRRERRPGSAPPG